MNYLSPRILLVIIGLLITSSASNAKDLVVNGSFEGIFQPIKGSTGQAKISGEVPRGWEDNSNWNDVIGRYERVGDAATGDLVVAGRQAIRMHHEGGQSERVTRMQMRQLIELEEGKTYRLAAAVRGPAGPVPSGHRRGVAIQIRQPESPYTVYSSISEDAGVNWQEHETQFTAPTTGSYLVNILLNDPGVVDVDAVSVTEVELEKYSGALEPGNFLPNGRFPVGAGGPFTWSFDHQVYNSKRVDGPLGDTAIHLPGGFIFKTPPIAVNAGRPYVFSVYLKSDAPEESVQVSFSSTARTGGEPIVQETWKVNSEWERYTFSAVMPPTPHDVVYVNLRSLNANGMSMDGLRLEEGETAKDYNDEDRVEVSIGLPAATLMQGIYVDGEAAELEIGATGTWSEGSKVELTLTDVYGDSTPLDPVLLEGTDVYRTKVSIAPNATGPQKSLGSFRLMARAVDASDKPLGPASEMTFVRVPKPLNPDELDPDSPAGIHARFNDFGLALAQKLGFKWIRNHDMTPGKEMTKWSYVEPDKGKMIWQDEMLKNVTEHGLLMVGLIDTSPSWANRVPPKSSVSDSEGFYRNYAPKDLEQYQSFLTALAEHYKGRILAYEVWNEPYSSTFFRDYQNGQTVHGTPEQLAAIHEAAHSALKKVDPEILVVGVCSGGGLTAYIEKAFAAGIFPHYDILAYHQYSNPNDPFTEVANPAKLVAEEAKYGGGTTPLWNTEGSPMPRISFFKEVNPIPNATAAEWSTEGDPLTLAAAYPRYMLASLAHGAEKVFFYSFEVRPSMVEERGFKLLEPTGVPIPGMGAVAALNKFLNSGAKFVEAINPQENVIALIFEGGGKTFAAIQSGDGKTTGWRPELSMENTLIYDLFGNRLAKVPFIAAAPVYIVLEGEHAQQLRDDLLQHFDTDPSETTTKTTK